MFDALPQLSPGLRLRDAITEFLGGLDLETPAWRATPGSLRDALNYELAIEGGYQDIKGYERFDGRPKPSDASYTILDFTETGDIAVGDTVTGATSGATGVVIAIANYPVPDDAQAYLVLTKVTGTFDEAAENLEVSAVVEGNTDAEGYADSAPTAKLAAQYKNLAADEYRSDIAEVPGEGNVWGGFSLADDKYALRNKVGGATAGLYKATVSGWTEVDLGRELAFTSGGVDEIEEGDTLTGLTSAATATVERVVLTSGTWAGGDAAGYLYLSGQTGTFQAENVSNDGAVDDATIAGNSTAITLQPDGRLDYDISNFADTQGPERAYGADGVNMGWEFDGTAFVWIRTGMADDTPDHVAVHKSKLFFSFDGSVQHSGEGEPYSWSVVLGSGEIATGHAVTGFQIEPGAEGNAALLIACRQQLFMLYGNDSSDWNLVRYRKKVGAYEWTIQQIAYTLFLDDRGITDYRTAQEFGNFDHSALSDRIRRLVNSKRELAVASCVVRDKNQYRLFFSDNTALYVTMKGSKLAGIMPISLEDDVTCAWSEEDTAGNEEVFFGSDNGFVYQMERGTSFDGENIYAYIMTHFDNDDAIEWMKGYEGSVSIEGKGTGYAELDMAYELDYGRSEVFQPNDQTAEFPLSQGALWDSGLEWDTGIQWDDTSLLPSVALDLRGEGRNISWIIRKDSDYFEPLLLSGVHYRYMARVQRRG